MGRLQADEMAELTDLDSALTWHLRANHYPPVPLTMLQACKDAIDYCSDGDSQKQVALPEGVLYRGSTTAPAYAIVQGHHLESWVQYDD